MRKTDLTFLAFSFMILQFNSAFAVSLSSTRSDARIKFDGGLIFLDQSQFLQRIAANEIASFSIEKDPANETLISYVGNGVLYDQFCSKI